MNLDYQHLAKKLDEDGGFSVSARGTTPKSGVMVSRLGSEEVHPAPVSPVALEEYATRMNEELAGRGRYLGAWRSGGKDYLDVGDRFTNRTQAANAINANKQIAGYDIDRQEVVAPMTWPMIPLEPNVEPTRPKRRGWREITGEIGRREAAPRYTQLELIEDA